MMINTDVRTETTQQFSQWEDLLENLCSVFCLLCVKGHNDTQRSGCSYSCALKYCSCIIQPVSTRAFDFS